MFRPLLGLAVLAAAAAPALAAGPETVAPIQAVVHEFGHEFGERTVQAYYTRGGGGTCELVLMTNQEPGPRVRVSLTPEQAATVEDVDGGRLSMTCGAAAARMTVERTLPSLTVERTPPLLRAASVE